MAKPFSKQRGHAGRPGRGPNSANTLGARGGASERPVRRGVPNGVSQRTQTNRVQLGSRPFSGGGESRADRGRGRPGREHESESNHDEGETSLRVVYGVGPVRELIERNPKKIAKILVDERRMNQGDVVFAAVEHARRLRVPIGIATRAELDAACGENALHQGVAAQLAPFQYADLEDVLAAAKSPALLVLLDGVEDPRNLGAIIRTAYLLGADGVIIPENRATGVTAVTAKASAGASELLPVVMVKNLVRTIEQCKQAGLWSVAVHASPSASPIAKLDFNMPLCLVLGSEGSGIRQLVAETCDFHAIVPMARAGVGSFNVSVACAMALYEVLRQRQLTT